MILAAGRGSRMRPLTDHTPKPLLRAGGKALIVWQVERLAAAGIRDVVVNLAHLGDQIETALGDGRAWGIRIAYSRETRALESAGGIVLALPMLGDEPFIVVNGDVYCDLDLATLLPVARELGEGERFLAHLVLVDNPPHHPGGDFAFEDGYAIAHGEPRLTFSGIGVYRPALFRGLQPGETAKLAPLLVAAMAARQVTARHFSGYWEDVGTPERLTRLDERLIRARGAPEKLP